MPKKSGGVEFPQDLSSLADNDLDTLETDAISEFDSLYTQENDPSEADVARMTELADGIDNVRKARTERNETRAQLREKQDSLRARVQPQVDETDVDTDVDANDVDEVIETSTETREPALVASTTQRKRTDVRDVLKDPRSKLNVKLSEARRHQNPLSKSVPLDEKFSKSVLVASADIPNYSTGGQLSDMSQLVDAYRQRGRSLPVSKALSSGRPIYDNYLDASTGRTQFGLVGHEGDWRNAPRFPIAQLQRNFRYFLEMGSSPEEAWNVMQAAANVDSLVAAGGWCSPSEISYDFYNIVAVDGLLDLPTTGIRRGGMRWPTSPSFGDLSSSTGLWHWTETQDIAAATGTAQSGTKTCARVPCASFNEARLEGEGICITAGNLTTDAWPEQIANFMRLVNAAHAHRVNSFFINQIVLNSTAVSLGVTGQGVAVPVLDAIEMQAIDMRTKYAMADGSVLEAFFPGWLLGEIRADLAKRKGYNSPAASFSITNAEIAGWFTSRGISAQFIQDYQVRGANQFGQSSALTAWPTTVQFVMYPAGTWLRGNGLNLDLGIVRDSTLNAVNDYTAAWSEEFFLLAKIGHESRVITVAITPNGAVGSDVTYTNPVL